MDRLGELRALYQERQLPQARELYEREPGHTDPEWYWLGSLVYWHLGEYPLSRLAADFGLSLRPEGELRVKLLQRVGTTEERLGAYGEAIDHLQECLRELPAYPSLSAILRGMVLYNLGVAFYHRNGNLNSLDSAIECYRAAAQEFRREGMQESLRGCLQNLAWTLCEAGRPTSAAEALDEAAPLCTTELARGRQTITNAYQLLAAGDYTRSLTTLQPLAEHIPNDDTFVLSLCITALAAAELHKNQPGTLRMAEEMVRQAIMAASRPGIDPGCWTAANRVQKRITAMLKQETRGA